jgi:hypothetical protein
MQRNGTASQVLEPLLSISTISSNNNNPTISNENHDNHVETDLVTEEQYQVERNNLLIYGLFGRPYALQWNFWWQHIFSAACLGGLVGCLVGAFFWSDQLVGAVLFPTLRKDMHGDSNDGSHHRHSQLGDWWWILITTTGALIASMVLELPGAPKPETFRTILHDIATLDCNFVDSIYAIISSWIALATGLPVGAFSTLPCCAL